MWSLRASMSLSTHVSAVLYPKLRLEYAIDREVKSSELLPSGR